MLDRYVMLPVWRLAIIRILGFFHNFSDKYIDRRELTLAQMNTNSFFMALSEKLIVSLTKMEMEEEYEVSLL